MFDGGVTITSQFVEGACGSIIKEINCFTAPIFKL